MDNQKVTINPWDLDSGLPDKVTANISNSEFNFVADYQNGEQPLLILTLEGADFDPFDVAFSLGKDWKIVENGKRIERQRENPSGGHQYVWTFHQSCGQRTQSAYVGRKFTADG